MLRSMDKKSSGPGMEAVDQNRRSIYYHERGIDVGTLIGTPNRESIIRMAHCT